MMLTPPNRPFQPRIAPKVRLRTTLVMTFLVQIVTAVGLVGYLSFRNAQQAVNTLASQIRSELGARIEQELKSYFDDTYGLNQLNSRALVRGDLELTNSETAPQLLEQLKISPFLYAIYCGNSQGQFLGAVRILENNSIGVWVANPDTGQHLYLYKTDGEGRLAELFRDRGSYDPRSRPWYQKAAQTKRPVWSDIYLAFSTQLPTVTASQPIYDPVTQELLGVCATDVLLSNDLRDFLSSLSIGKSGLAFVSDRQGNIVSSSTDESLTVGTGKEAKLLKAANSQNPLVRAATESLSRQFKDFNQINQPLQTDFLLNQQRQLLQVLPFKDKRGLDWLIWVIVPEADVMDKVNRHYRLTLSLCLAAFITAVIAGILTARWIAQPILKLSQASEAIAHGELNQSIKVRGITELEILASSFNSMAKQLQDSFANLEAKNADLDAAKEQLEAVLNAVPGSISWMGANGVYLGVNRYLADTLNLHPEDVIGRELGFFSMSSDYVEFIQDFMQSSEQAASQIILIYNKNQPRYYLMAAQKYQQGTAVVTVGIDITERRQAEEALRIAEENYRSIYENALEGIFQCSANGDYINVNPAMARIFGYNSPADLMEKLADPEYQLYVEPNHHDQFIQLMQEQGSVSNLETQVYHAQGHPIWISQNACSIFDHQGNLLYYQGFIADITNRKKADKERQTLIEELFELNCNLEIAMQTQLELTEAASRFVPHQFLSILGYESIADVQLAKGMQQEMSILFSDIRDFTSLSEKMAPEENFKFINAYLSRMEPMIIEHHGFIDKYIGDAIMALFDGTVDHAIQAGIAMLKSLNDYNTTRGRPERPKLSIGIGINTGSLILGTVGGPSRMDSTVISDSVNLASRIEKLTKEFGVPLLISEYTFNALQNKIDYAIRLVGRVQVKGKSNMVSVFEVFDADSLESKEAKLATQVVFEEAVIFYNMKNHDLAELNFQQCLKLNPSDRVAQIYLERLANLKTT